ncbi:MAG TPA: DUF4386 domain-containing protein [Chitinophagaceae bacterium]|nr:DUF4386 domain-containing protein [Chitinophagaceae bacterium]
MKQEKTIGWLLITGAVGVLIPYTMLTIMFEYPDILRQDTSIILTKFHEGGNRLIWTWFAFALIGLPLIPAYIRIGQILENKSSLVRTATTLGVIGLIVQVIGLLRWTFVIPVIANSYLNAADEASKAAADMNFKTIHQFAGVLLGEHLGQLLTIIWTVLMSITFSRLKLVPGWVNILGFISASIYLLAQAELLATVMPDFPVWGLAGFTGSTLWLVWLLIIGILFLRKQVKSEVTSERRR